MSGSAKRRRERRTLACLAPRKLTNDLGCGGVHSGAPDRRRWSDAHAALLAPACHLRQGNLGTSGSERLG